MGCCGRTPPEVGWTRSRGCTDIVFLILFIVVWALMGFVTYVALTTGDLNRLTRGVDFQGNACGILVNGEAPENVVNSNGTRMTAEEWQTRGSIWWPIASGSNAAEQLKELEATAIATKVLKLGVCVTSCPTFTGFTPGSINQQVAYDAQSTMYPVLYPSRQLISFCIPQLEGTQDGIKQVIEKVVQQFGIGEFLLDGASELVAALPVLAISFGSALLLSFLFLSLLRVIATPMTYIIIGVMLVVLIGSGFGLWFLSGNLDSIKIDFGVQQDYLVLITQGVAVFCWVLGAVYLLLIIWLVKNIKIAVQVIKLCSKVLSQVRTLILVPAINFVFLVVLTWYTIIVFAFLQTSGELKEEQETGLGGIFGEVITEKTVYILQRKNSAQIMQYGVLFVYLWTLGWFNAMSYMITSFVAVFWYFSGQGDKKSMPWAVVIRSYYYTIRYHLGTVIIGSFIIAILRFLRISLSMIQARLRQIVGPNKMCIIYVCLCCLKCCLCCWENLIRYISKNAYILTAINGKGFCKSAYTAIQVLLKHLVTVGTANFIAEFLILLMRWVIVALNCTACYLLMKHTHYGDDMHVYVMPLLVIALITWFVSGVYAYLFSTLQDTLLICFCWDNENYGGQYVPAGLQKLVSKYGASQPYQPSQVAPANKVDSP